MSDYLSPMASAQESINLEPKKRWAFIQVFRLNSPKPPSQKTLSLGGVCVGVCVFSCTDLPNLL